jgi:hypothetical protein
MLLIRTVCEFCIFLWTQYFLWRVLLWRLTLYSSQTLTVFLTNLTQCYRFEVVIRNIPLPIFLNAWPLSSVLRCVVAGDFAFNIAGIIIDNSFTTTALRQNRLKCNFQRMLQSIKCRLFLWAQTHPKISKSKTASCNSSTHLLSSPTTYIHLPQ